MEQRRPILDALRSTSLVGLDTPVFIYHIEHTSRWAIAASTILRAVADSQFAGITSVLTLLEMAIKPLRLGRPEVAAAYEGLVQTIPHLTTVAIDARVARIGAELRAWYGLRTPDALQIAACLAHGAEAFVTSDRRLRRVREINVLVLDDFV